MFNQYPYFRFNNTYNRFNNYNPAFFTKKNNVNPIQEDKKNNEEIEENLYNQPKTDDATNSDNEQEKRKTNHTNNESKNTKFRLGPIDITNERLSIFGFPFAFDDLLLIGLILILLLDSDCDYALIIVLGLMLLNINISSLNLFKFF